MTANGQRCTQAIHTSDHPAARGKGLYRYCPNHCCGATLTDGTRCRDGLAEGQPAGGNCSAGGTEETAECVFRYDAVPLSQGIRCSALYVRWLLWPLR